MCIIPWIIAKKATEIKMQRPKLFIIRSLLTTASLILWFYVLEISVTVIDATAISYMTPLFTVLAGWLFVHEKMNSKLIAALLIGFIGALIILRPGFTRVSLAEILAIATAFIWALTDIVIKIQSRIESIISQTFFNTILMILFSAPLAYSVWVTPPLNEIYYVIIIGVLFLINNVTLTLSYRAADLIVVAPFSFTRLLFTSILAFIFFGETIDNYELIGSMVILCASVYIIYTQKKSLVKG
jgi:S-adenosylmethionine uptake transporter